MNSVIKCQMRTRRRGPKHLQKSFFGWSFDWITPEIHLALFRAYPVPKQHFSITISTSTTVTSYVAVPAPRPAKLPASAGPPWDQEAASAPAAASALPVPLLRRIQLAPPQPAPAPDGHGPGRGSGGGSRILPDETAGPTAPRSPGHVPAASRSTYGNQIMTN